VIVGGRKGRTAMTERHARMSGLPSSWFTIVAVLVLELVVAAIIALAVAQLFIGYECGDAAYRQAHVEQCDAGFPYPLLATLAP
jgi:hypothetical protein